MGRNAPNVQNILYITLSCSLFDAIETSNSSAFLLWRALISQGNSVANNSFYLNSPQLCTNILSIYAFNASTTAFSLCSNMRQIPISRGDTAYKYWIFNVRSQTDWVQRKCMNMCKKHNTLDFCLYFLSATDRWSGRERDSMEHWVHPNGSLLIARCVASLYSSGESPFPVL